jgi:DNA-binding NarL/FixJ family response regulator
MESPINILHVENSLIISNLLKRMFIALGNGSILNFAGTSSEAQTMFRECPRDIVILDIHLTDNSGLDLLIWLKKEYPDVWVVVLSGHADEYHRHHARTLGARYFFDKTLELEQFTSFIFNLKETYSKK